MKNKTRNKFSGLLCLLLLALLPTSCIQDDFAGKNKATVKVTFTTRAISNSTVPAGELESNEHMRTLRVIVARVSNNEILYNVRYDIDETEKQKTITFSELTVNADGEDFDFYAIANEEGISNVADWDNVTVSQLSISSGNILLDENDINAMNVGTRRIPQTGYKRINVKAQQGGGIQSETIPLQFAVAKVRLTINNTSTELQTVSEIKLSGVNMTSTPLFADAEEDLSDVNSGSVSLGNMTIPAENNGTPGKSTVYAYFYENTGGDYNLTATWEGHGPKELDINKAVTPNIMEIPRGKMLDINVNLSVNTEPTVNVQVVSWTTKDMNVPAFQ